MQNLRLVVPLVVIIFLHILLPGRASALPRWLGNLTESGAESLFLKGQSQEVTATLLLEKTKWRYSHEFGIYGFRATEDGIEVTDMLAIFHGSDTRFVSRSIHFDLASGQVWLDGSMDKKNIGPVFGFYLKTQKNNSQIFYTHTVLNSDKKDHSQIFETGGNTPIIRQLYPDVVIAFEDWKGGGDGDFNDMVVGMKGVTTVPEPVTILLLGIGLVGLAGLARKKRV